MVLKELSLIFEIGTRFNTSALVNMYTYCIRPTVCRLSRYWDIWDFLADFGLRIYRRVSQGRYFG